MLLLMLLLAAEARQDFFRFYFRAVISFPFSQGTGKRCCEKNKLWVHHLLPTFSLFLYFIVIPLNSFPLCTSVSASPKAMLVEATNSAAAGSCNKDVGARNVYWQH
jgi:hypothetical protein